MGHRQFNRTKPSIFFGPLNAAADTQVASAEDDATMFIGKVGTGLHWSRCLGNGSGKVFSQCGFEYQYWGTTDLAATAASTVIEVDISAGTAVVNAGSNETHFLGLTVMAGYAW